MLRKCGSVHTVVPHQICGVDLDPELKCSIPIHPPKRECLWSFVCMPRREVPWRPSPIMRVQS